MRNPGNRFERRTIGLVLIIALTLLWPVSSFSYVMNGNDKVSDADITSDGSFLITKGSYKEGIKIYKLPSMEVYKELHNRDAMDDHTNVAFAPDNKTFAAMAKGRKHLDFYDIHSLRKVKSFPVEGMTPTPRPLGKSSILPPMAMSLSFIIHQRTKKAGSAFWTQRRA